MHFSLIVPSYNEAENLAAFFDTAIHALAETSLACEVVFVDDGSTDDTLLEIKRLIGLYEQQTSSSTTSTVSFKVVSFTRNFGKEAAMFSGLERATGEFIGVIDADMQQDPHMSVDMFRFLEEHPDYDCVAGVPEKRQEGAVLKAFKDTFYRVFNLVGEVEIPLDASDFRVFRSSVARALLQMPEYFRFSKGLFAWVGYKTYLMPYTPRKRTAGASKWSFRKLFSYATGGIMSFSTWPLKLTIYLGLVAAAGAVLYLFYVLYEKAALGIDIPGYPTLVCLILLFSGVVMLILGIFGEYLGRIYIETKHRPLYIARETLSYGRRECGDGSEGGDEGALGSHPSEDIAGQTR